MKRHLFFAGVLISILGGIWFGLEAYISPGSFQRYPNDWIWFVFYGVVLLIGLSLGHLNRGRYLLLATISIMAIFIPITLFRAALIKEFFAFLILLVTSFGLGNSIYKVILRGTESSNPEKILFSLLLGFGGLMILGLLMGGVGGFNKLTVYLVMGLIFSVTIPWWVNLIKYNALNILETGKTIWQKADLTFFSLAIFVLVVFLIGPYLWATAPTVRWDALSYHVAVPQIYIDHGAMIEISESSQTYWAHYAEMLYTIALLLGGQPLPGWLHLLMGVMTSVFVALFGARLINWRIGTIAAILYLILPLVNYEIGTAYVDGFITLFVTAMLFASFNWYRYKSESWLVMSGILAGIAIGIKLNALPFVFSYLIIVIIYCIWQKYPLSVVIRSLVLICVPAIILWTPWLIRETIWTGNPIFPNYNSIFKSPKWPELELFAVNAKIFLNIGETLMIPWDLVANSNKFYHETTGGALLSLPWLSLPWFYLLPNNRQNKKRLGYVFSYVFLSVFILFCVVKHARYLMPVYPLMGLLAAFNLELGWRIINENWNHKITYVIGSILTILYLISSQFSIIIRMPTLAERYPYRYVLGLENKNDFLNRTLPFYHAFQYLDDLPYPPKVFSLGIEFRLYTNAHIFGGLFSHEVQQILKNSKTPSELANALKMYGYDYLLIYSPDYYFRSNVYNSPGLTKNFFDEYTEIVSANNRTYLYKLNFDNFNNKSLGKNLLKDPGFEKSTKALSNSWALAGNPQFDQTGSVSHSGVVTALLNVEMTGESSTLSQIIPVDRGNIYTLSAWSKEIGEGATLQLMIKWFDHEGKEIKMDYDWIPLNTKWDYYWLSAQSPISANKAEVSFAIFGGNGGYLDDTSFFDNIISH